MFYHLTETALEDALPVLVEKALGRNWRVAIQTGSFERVDQLDDHLWTYRSTAFLPHGRDGDTPEDHPIWLTFENGNPNDAVIRFLVDGAQLPADLADYQRIMVMFDGTQQEAVQQARAQWKTLKSDGHTLSYYQQTTDGRWTKAA